VSELSESFAEIMAEFQRLGLRLDDLPYGAFAAAPGGAERFLEELRRLQPGATWHEVFPDLPPHWVPGRPETWIRPYRPLGAYDYPTLPTGPAMHVHWPAGSDSDPLPAFVATARAAGFRVFGAGLIEQIQEWRQFDAHVVLDRDTSEEEFDEFFVWVNEQPDVEIAVITRPVGTRYLQ
jgi:hypothetical protein